MGEQQPEMRQLKAQIITDCDEERLSLPYLRDPRIRPSTVWTILKDLAGQDITKYSMPVIVNEPLSNLQKSAEMYCFNYLLD